MIHPIELLDGEDLREIGLDLYNGRIEILCNETLRPYDPAADVGTPVEEAFRDIENIEVGDLPEPHSAVTFRPVVAVTADTNAVFETSVGVIHRINDRTRFVAHAERGQPQVVDEDVATLVTENLHATVNLDSEQFAEVFDDVEENRFGQTQTEYKEWAVERLQQHHTTTVTYTGDNNVTYNETCEPNRSDISVQSIEPVYLPEVRHTTDTQEYTYPYEYYAAGASTVIRAASTSRTRIVRTAGQSPATVTAGLNGLSRSRCVRTSGCCVSMPDGKLRSTRRRLLGGLAGVGMAATTGCLGTVEAAGFQQESAWRDPPLVEDRPNAVYLPAITEGMKMYGMTTSGPYGLAVMYSYPHRFWTVTGDEVGKTVVEADDSIHLMVSLWDKETGTTLPIDSGITIEITNDDGLVTQEVAYPMLSQQMGLHYGANYELSGEGSYTATVRVGGVPLRRTGTLSGRLESVQTTAFDFRVLVVHHARFRFPSSPPAGITEHDSDRPEHYHAETCMECAFSDALVSYVRLR